MSTVTYLGGGVAEGACALGGKFWRAFRYNTVPRLFE